ncbi:MAG: hypothetical protein ACYDHN_01065 [Solirubrobacteraceae bacterium]
MALIPILLGWLLILSIVLGLCVAASIGDRDQARTGRASRTRHADEQAQVVEHLFAHKAA